MNEDDLLDELPFGSAGTPFGNDPFFACEIGEALWRAYRVKHPEAPIEPPVCPEDHAGFQGDSAPYWEHVSACGHCNEE